jgi:hypothetical protein
VSAVPTTVDLTDLPLVSPAKVMLPMRYLIDSGRGLAMLNGLSNGELREVDGAVWDQLNDAPKQRVAVLLRLRCLIRVFRARRLAALFLNEGFHLIAPAVHVASRMRLDADRGFNPLKFERALRGLLAQLDTSSQDPAEMPIALSA